MNTPQHVLETVTTLREERTTLQGKLDAVELALDNMARIWPAPVVAAPAAGLHVCTPLCATYTRRKYTRPAKPAKGKKAKRRAQGSGLKVAKKVEPVVRVNAADAAARRATLLELIQKSDVGLTGTELRQRTSKMDPKDRQNALSTLKQKGEIRRTGNTWTKAA